MEPQWHGMQGRELQDWYKNIPQSRTRRIYRQTCFHAIEISHITLNITIDIHSSTNSVFINAIHINCVLVYCTLERRSRTLYPYRRRLICRGGSSRTNYLPRCSARGALYVFIYINIRTHPSHSSMSSTGPGSSHLATRPSAPFQTKRITLWNYPVAPCPIPKQVSD